MTLGRKPPSSRPQGLHFLFYMVVLPHREHPEELMTVLLFTWVPSKPVLHTAVATKHLLISSSCCPWDGGFEPLSIVDQDLQNLQLHVSHSPSVFLLLATMLQTQSFQREPRRDRVSSQTWDQNRFISYREPKNFEDTDRVFSQHSLTILNYSSDQNIPGTKEYYIGGEVMEYIFFHPSFLPYNSWNPWNLQSNWVLATGKTKAI